MEKAHGGHSAHIPARSGGKPTEHAIVHNATRAIPIHNLSRPSKEDLSDILIRMKFQHVSHQVKQRLQEFQLLHAHSDSEWFSELCFCLLTANSSAQMGMKVQRALGDKFAILPRKALSTALRKLGYRFYNKRAEYIVLARKHAPGLRHRILSLVKKGGTRKAREWLVENVKGIGYKEASHFLRNVGYKDVAILDRHILRILHRNGLIPRMPRSLDRITYLKYENLMRIIAFKVGMNLAALDLYLWHLETGKVLK
ncbi:MAG: N-glycosylase/DNA lyase [Candidatus Bilamarchaeaceae archaeon]